MILWERDLIPIGEDEFLRTIFFYKWKIDFEFTKMQKSFLFLKEPNEIIFESTKRYICFLSSILFFPFWTLEFEMNLV